MPLSRYTVLLPNTSKSRMFLFHPVQIKIPRGDISEFAEIELIIGEKLVYFKGESEEVLASMVDRHQKLGRVGFYRIITAVDRLVFRALYVKFDIIYSIFVIN